MPANTHTENTIPAFIDFDGMSDLCSQPLWQSHGANTTDEARLAYYQNIIQTLPAGILILDEAGKIFFANHSAEEILNCKLQNHYWREIIQTQFAPQKEDGHEVSCKNGKKISLQTYPMFPYPGQLICLNDLSETRRIQEDINQKKRLISLGLTVAKLAHQIRTPLATAMLYAKNLEKNELSPEQRKVFLKKLILRLEALDAELNRTLLFAKSGDSLACAVSVNTLLQEIAATVEGLTQEDRVTFTVKSFEENLNIRVNQCAIIGAFQNLIANAVQSTEDAISVSLYAVHEESTLTVYVEDNGPGISDDLKTKITEQFFTTREEGSGLGLSVVVAVAKSHRAKFHIGSNLQGGTTALMCFDLA